MFLHIPKAALAAAIVSCLGLGACAHKDARPTANNAVYDPAQGVNRRIFGVTRTVDNAVLAPAARGYERATPQVARKRLRTFAANLRGPSILANDLLQANLGRAGETSARFLINSTVGAAGLFDVADGLGLDPHEADLGQTLGRWGVPPGPSVQAPLLGPSNLRDLGGDIIGGLLDPTTYLTGGASIAVTALDATDLLDERAQSLPFTDDLQRSSPDYYLDLRDHVAKERAQMVAQAKSPKNKAVDDLD